MCQQNVCCHCLITVQPLQQLPADAGSFAPTLSPTKGVLPSPHPAAIHSLNGENALARSVGGLGQI